ncbi:hypothetical protein FACS1894102_7700 [Spirochaetia bacterium]|nr:hypothetical protein FACS1894102_7700 [Spirochaetia bacterium]
MRGNLYRVLRVEDTYIPLQKNKKVRQLSMITLTVRDGQKPTKEQLKRIKAACKKPITYTSDCPESTPAALAEFAAKARALRQSRKNKKPAVTLRIHHESLEVYKALGKGYVDIMADVLTYAAKDTQFLERAMNPKT